MLQTLILITTLLSWLNVYNNPQRSTPDKRSLVADTIIVVRAVAGLQFEQPRIVVKPRTRLQLVFENADDMAHNMVITKPNSRLNVVEAAMNMGAEGANRNYVPTLDEVLAHTPIVEPSHIDTLTLMLDEGAYPYVCTYPGHGYIMYGVLYVTREPKRLPPLEADPYVPKRGEPTSHTVHSMPSAHPYPMTFPMVYRTFMPECGPAAIAVGLPEEASVGQQSYCWDAGSCRLRYAWVGGFVDSYGHWEGNGNRLTKVVGDIYYRDKAGFPFKVGNSSPTPRFKGYQLVNRYPMFMYAVGNVSISELIKPASRKRGLVRQFTLASVHQPLTFIVDQQEGVVYQARIGTALAQVRNGRLILPAGTRQFTITMLVP